MLCTARLHVRIRSFQWSLNRCVQQLHVWCLHCSGNWLIPSVCATKYSEVDCAMVLHLLHIPHVQGYSWLTRTRRAVVWGCHSVCADLKRARMFPTSHIRINPLYHFYYKCQILPIVFIPSLSNMYYFCLECEWTRVELSGVRTSSAHSPCTLLCLPCVLLGHVLTEQPWRTSVRHFLASSEGTHRVYDVTSHRRCVRESILHPPPTAYLLQLPLAVTIASYVQGS